MRHHPSCDEVVIVSIKLILSEPPLLISETGSEILIFENGGSVGDRPAGHAGHPAVHVGRCRAIEVSPFEIECPQKSIYSLREIWILCTAQALTRHNSAEFLALKRGQ